MIWRGHRTPMGSALCCIWPFVTRHFLISNFFCVVNHLATVAQISFHSVKSTESFTHHRVSYLSVKLLIWDWFISLSRSQIRGCLLWLVLLMKALAGRFCPIICHPKPSPSQLWCSLKPPCNAEEGFMRRSRTKTLSRLPQWPACLGKQESSPFLHPVKQTYQYLPQIVKCMNPLI